MDRYNSIAVIYGCDSSEWEVSCRSGEFVASRIDGGRYDVYEIFARFGSWSLVAYRRKNSMRVILPEDGRQLQRIRFGHFFRQVFLQELSSRAGLRQMCG